MKTLFFALLFASCTSHAASELRIGGGAAPINNIFRKVQAPFEKETGIKLVLTEDGPDAALRSLDEGKLDIASAGLGEKDWVSLTTVEKKIELKNLSDFKYRVIGKDLIGVITHGAIKLQSLSPEQLKALFTGQTKNWKELGGPDVNVVLVYGEKIPGTNKFFKKAVMDDAEYVANKVAAGAAPDVLAKVKETPGAIGLAPMGLDTRGVNEPKIREVGRPVTAATKGAPSADANKLFQFISGDGAKYLR